MAKHDFLKQVVRDHLRKQYGDNPEEWKSACKRALRRDLPEIWRRPFEEVLAELQEVPA